MIAKTITESGIVYALVLGLVAFLLSGCASDPGKGKIDREELVQRHKVMVNSFDSLSSLTVGNGSFAFTVDFTGLQTFPEKYERGIPLGTQAEWGWHSFPNAMDYALRESMKNYDFHGRQISYTIQWNEPGRNQDAANYLRQNPHRLHLGIIGLDLIHEDGSPVSMEEIRDIDQTLNPWTGEIHSSFSIKGLPVEVITCSHQNLDLISARIKSPLIGLGLLRLKLRFPYPSGQHTDSGCDWNHPEKHSSTLEQLSPNSAIIRRKMDSSIYHVRLSWSGRAGISENAFHNFCIIPEKGVQQFSLSCLFSSADTVKSLPGYRATIKNSRDAWKRFWLSGGAVDLSGSTDPRASELERRIILSQYLTKIQCAGEYPPQETGLTYNSWFGKFHLEMHWWHAVHFALWDRIDLLEKSLDWYGTIKENAYQTAERQGFDGLRWPKMTEPCGNDSPSGVGTFLIWQQPHFIYFAELCYRDAPDEAVLRKYADLVFATADFMASFAWYDSVSSRYILGPALIPAQERFPPETTINPSFELAYWHWGLATAQKWRERLHLERNPEWDRVIHKLSPLAQEEGLYLATESATDSYTNPRYMGDHPMVLGAYGMLPSCPLTDTAAMKRTFDFIWNHWNWNETWGWDFPMVAMSATRLGMPRKAIDALFMKVAANTYLPNGHNYQDERLRLYLPGNGGLLAAVAMMCAGYDDTDEQIPGFPKEGTWKVKWEGLKKLP